MTIPTIVLGHTQERMYNRATFSHHQIPLLAENICKILSVCENEEIY